MEGRQYNKKIVAAVYDPSCKSVQSVRWQSSIGLNGSNRIFLDFAPPVVPLQTFLFSPDFLLFLIPLLSPISSRSCTIDAFSIAAKH